MARAVEAAPIAVLEQSEVEGIGVGRLDEHLPVGCQPCRHGAQNQAGIRNVLDDVEEQDQIKLALTAALDFARLPFMKTAQMFVLLKRSRP